ncbi:MAG: hypothetical protein U0L84_05800 [Acutalibacteraceae bacterium]|nr:hypothetical protein [Acutalibacteraceae bacterium]
MLKKAFLLSFCIILILVGVTLVYYNKTSIIGTWESDATVIGLNETKNTKVYLIFNKDGSAVFKNPIANENDVDKKFEYVVSDNVITVLSVEGEALNESYTYKIKNNILKIKVNNRETEYKRVKKSD